MKAISIACSVTLLSLFVGGCGGTDSGDTSRQPASGLMGDTDEPIPSQPAEENNDKAVTFSPLEPLVIKGQNSWLRIETPAFLDDELRETASALLIAMDSMSEALKADASDEINTYYTSSNGHVVEKKGVHWFVLDDPLGFISASTPSPIYQGDPEEPQLHYSSLQNTSVWSEFSVPDAQEIMMQKYSSSNLTTIGLSIGLEESSHSLTDSKEISGNTIIPMTISSPCGSIDAQFEFHQDEHTPRQWRTSLFLEGEKIPLVLHDRSTQSNSESKEVPINFDKYGVLDIGDQEYLMLSSNNVASHLNDKKCMTNEHNDWKIVFLIHKKFVYLIGEKYPFNYSENYGDTYGELKFSGFEIIQDILYVNYGDSAMLPIGYARIESKQSDNDGYLITYNTLDLGITGDGYFVFSPDTSDKSVSLSRLGKLRLDSKGFLVNTRGEFLQGYPIGSIRKDMAAEPMKTIPLQIPEFRGLAKATSKVAVKLSFSPFVTPLDATAFDPMQTNSYTYSRMLYIYDAEGKPHETYLYFVRDATTENLWVMYCVIDGWNVPFDDGAGTPIPYASFAFDEDGHLNTDRIFPRIFKTLHPTSPGQTITIDISGSDMHATTNTGATADEILKQDGFGPESYVRFHIDHAGIVKATQDNGHTVALGKIALATAQNPQTSESTKYTPWTTSLDSDDVQLGEAGSAGFGYIHYGVLEVSWLP